MQNDGRWRLGSMPTNNYIRVIERTLCVLEAFKGKPDVALTELATRARMVKSSVFRILHTLEQLGYVEKTPSGRYSITSRFGQLVENSRLQVPEDLSSLVHPYMQELLNRFQETVNLGVLDEGKVLYIRVLESPHAFRLAAHAGIRSPLHSTALGKCLLCQHTRADVERLLGNKDLPRFTNRTICDRALFFRELDRVRKRGYAIDDMEDSAGARCLGAPIFNAQGKVVAALSISSPVSRVDRTRAREIGETLLSSCQQISKLLGYSSTRFLLAQAGD